MKPGNLKYLLPLTAVLALAGCASAPIAYEVRDHAGELVVSQAVDVDRPEDVLQEQQVSLVEGDYRRCRALAALIRDAWPLDGSITAEARRMAAWCLLFTYESNPGAISALVNEARNLDILDAALAEFRRLPPSRSGEVDVLVRSVEERMRHHEAFDATVAALRSASRSNQAGAGTTAIMEIQQHYPEWSAAIGLATLVQFPWNLTENPQ